MNLKSIMTYYVILSAVEGKNAHTHMHFDCAQCDSKDMLFKL